VPIEAVSHEPCRHGESERNLKYAKWGTLVVTLLTALGCGSSKSGTVGTGGTGDAGQGGSGGSGDLGGQGGTNAAVAGGGGSGGMTAAPGGSAGSGAITGSAGVASPGGMTSTGGTTAGLGGGSTGGMQGVSGMTMVGAGGRPPPTSALVTSTNRTWTTSATWTETSSASVDLTVDDTDLAQIWEGFGGAFHEIGCNQLSTPALINEVMGLLFGLDGASFALARIPVGASDYALERYTLADTGTDVVPDDTESNRPAADPTLSTFSIERDKQTLIPFIKAALAINPNIRFWAVPWTPPVWMKTGYNKISNFDGLSPATRPSYFDGGTMKNDSATLLAYANYLVQFVQGYQAEGITIDAIVPQNEPTFEQNYPSCLWDNTTYADFVGKYLGPALLSAGFSTKVMVGMLASDPKDIDLMTAVMEDSLAKSFVGTIGIEWNVLSAVLETTPLMHDLPVWVTEHKCGNYPFITSARGGTDDAPPIGAYAEPPPNDQSYAYETWWYIRDAITKAKVTAYTLPHMVLDTVGKGNDTTRDWAQQSLLVVDGDTVVKTQAYYVVRHFSQFVDPGATVVGTSGGDAVAFKNPDGSLVAVFYSAEAKSDYTVAIGGKQLQFAVPANGWTTVKYVP
jgi:glucosylceramidase